MDGSRWLISLLGLMLLSFSFLYDFQTKMLPPSAPSPLPDPAVVQRPSGLLSENIYFTNAVCDDSYRCSLAGVGKKGDAFKEIIQQSCFRDTHTRKRIPATFQRFHWFHQELFRDRSMDNFVAHFTVAPADHGNLNFSAGNNMSVWLKCNRKHGEYPVIYRPAAFQPRLVLLVSQYYSAVNLEWVRHWLRHYLSLEVDLIVLYTGFPQNTKYSTSLDRMLNRTEFKGKVMRLNWKKVASLDIWAKAQITMINHGCMNFRGAVILGADLDEIIVPRGETKSLKQISNRFTKQFGTWYLHFRQFELDVKESGMLKRMTNKGVSQVNFTAAVKHARMCNHRSPFHCRAKYMFRSLDVESCSTHQLQLHHGAVFNHTEDWLSPSTALMIHLRGIQTLYKSSKR